MAEVKITCPNCFSEDRCFESKMEIEDFSSYMCFNCGFTSNSLYKNETDTLEKAKESSTQLMKDISMYDYNRKIHWFPTVLNMGKLGLIYPEGTKDNWSWKFASENARTFGQYEFLDACKKMGVIKDID